MRALHKLVDDGLQSDTVLARYSLAISACDISNTQLDTLGRCSDGGILGPRLLLQLEAPHEGSEVGSIVTGA
jgi:hypothetical protein